MQGQKPIIIAVLVLFCSCKDKRSAPNLWLDKAKQVADSTIASAFGLESLDKYFILNEKESFYWDTTLVDTAKDIYEGQMFYDMGVNYIPFLYTFSYDLKNNHTTFPYKTSVKISRDFMVHGLPGETCKLNYTDSLPSKAQLSELIKRFGLDSDACVSQYICDFRGRRDNLTGLLLLLQQFVDDLPEDRICYNAYLEKVTYINPWTKELISTTVDTVRTCELE